MLSDITLGQFFPGKSPIHKLDPRTKIILATVYIVAIFLANNPVAFLLLTFITLMLVKISELSFSTVIKGIKPIIFILNFRQI